MWQRWRGVNFGSNLCDVIYESPLTCNSWGCGERFLDPDQRSIPWTPEQTIGNKRVFSLIQTNCASEHSGDLCGSRSESRKRERRKESVKERAPKLYSLYSLGRAVSLLLFLSYLFIFGTLVLALGTSSICVTDLSGVLIIKINIISWKGPRFRVKTRSPKIIKP